MSNFADFTKAANVADMVPVVASVPVGERTPLSIYRRLTNGAVNAFLFESAEAGETHARYSFIGANPEFVVSGNGDQVIERRPEQTRVFDGSIFEFLRERLSGNRVFGTSYLPAFVGGAIGTLDFSCASWLEPGLRKSTRADRLDAEFMFYRSFVAFDHLEQVLQVITLIFTDDRDRAQLEAAYLDAVGRNHDILQILDRSEPPEPDPRMPATAPSIRSNWTRADFEAAVCRIKEYIMSGDAYQVVLSQSFRRATTASPELIYSALRSINPSPYMFLLKTGKRSIIGSSPEMLVRCRGQNLEYFPIAGTRRRGKDKATDDALANEMRVDPKEVAEHVMLVDLGRNDLGRVARYGSVKVERLMEVEKYSHVQHLVSKLSAELADGRDRFDAFAACFPAGTVSGAPKVRAIEIIHGLEPTPRGRYAGAVGYFDYAGNMDTCIAIRMIDLENGVATIQAGAGIVADSIPEHEYEETVNKARAMLRAIEIAEEG